MFFLYFFVIFIKKVMFSNRNDFFFYFLEKSLDIEISIYMKLKSKTRILYIFIDYFIQKFNNYTDVRQFLVFDQVN